MRACALRGARGAGLRGRAAAPGLLRCGGSRPVPLLRFVGGRGKDDQNSTHEPTAAGKLRSRPRFDDAVGDAAPAAVSAGFSLLKRGSAGSRANYRF